MHDKKAAVLPLSVVYFKGILDVERLLYRLCDVYLIMSRYGPFMIFLGLRQVFVPRLVMCREFSVFDPECIKENLVSTKQAH